jgi:hypothetical protein
MCVCVCERESLRERVSVCVGDTHTYAHARARARAHTHTHTGKPTGNLAACSCEILQTQHGHHAVCLVLRHAGVAGAQGRRKCFGEREYMLLGSEGGGEFVFGALGGERALMSFFWVRLIFFVESGAQRACLPPPARRPPALAAPGGERALMSFFWVRLIFFVESGAQRACLCPHPTSLTQTDRQTDRQTHAHAHSTTCTRTHSCHEAHKTQTV